MIVSCPSCSSRYRIRDEKVSERGARISCPSCAHKFVVHREETGMVVGADDGARGVPVTFARGGRPMRNEFADEDDEADVPTTVMPHGSQLTESIRATAEAQRIAKGSDAADGGAGSSARARESAPPTGALPSSNREEPPLQLRAAARARAAARTAPRAGSGSSPVLVLLGVAVVFALVVVAVVLGGLLPSPIGGV